LVRLPVALPFQVIRALVKSGILQPDHYQINPAGRPDFRYVNLLPDVRTLDRLIEFAGKEDSAVPEKWKPVLIQELKGIRPKGEDIALKGLEKQEEMRSDMTLQIVISTAVSAALGLYGIMLASGKAGPIHTAVSAPFRGLYHLIRAPFDKGEGLVRFWKDLSTPFRYRGIPTLLKVGTNMTEQAREGEFRPVADPTTPEVAEKIENTINSKFNTMSVLVEGPPGWGKEEVMKTLALRNPETVFIKVTPNGLMGGTMYRGQLEERLTDIPREIVKAKKSGRQVVLFVDEFHESLSAGKSMEQTTSLLEHWKGELARGDIRIVGFSTPRELLKARYVAGLYNDPASRARLSPEFQEEVSRFEKEGVRQNIELRPLLNRFQPLALPPRPASDIEVILKDTIEARKANGLTVEMDDATVKRIARLSESPLASEGHIPRTAFAIFNGVVDANATKDSGTVRVTTAMIDDYVATNYPDIAQRFRVAGPLGVTGSPEPASPALRASAERAFKAAVGELWENWSESERNAQLDSYLAYHAERERQADGGRGQSIPFEDSVVEFVAAVPGPAPEGPPFEKFLDSIGLVEAERKNLSPGELGKAIILRLSATGGHQSALRQELVLLDRFLDRAPQLVSDRDELVRRLVTERSAEAVSKDRDAKPLSELMSEYARDKKIEEKNRDVLLEAAKRIDKNLENKRKEEKERRERERK
jgi:hypothetical protein